MDESGNTGNNLSDSSQPLFLLAALLVHENQWMELEARLLAALEPLFPSPRHEGFELHGTDLRSGRNACAGIPLGQRLGLRDAWFTIAAEMGLRLFYRHIVKARYARWLDAEFGARATPVNPHIAAFAFTVQAVNRHLTRLGPDALGILISDENKETSPDLERAHRQLRMSDDDLRLSRIIEKGFFINSAASLPLQLCDLCALYARKKEEAKAGLTVHQADHSGIDLIEPLIQRAGERQNDVLAWLVRQHKKTKSGQGDELRGR